MQDALLTWCLLGFPVFHVDVLLSCEKWNDAKGTWFLHWVWLPLCFIVMGTIDTETRSLMTCEMNNSEIRVKFVFSPDVSLCGWVGSKHHLTNCLEVRSVKSSLIQARSRWGYIELLTRIMPSWLIHLFFFCLIPILFRHKMIYELDVWWFLLSSWLGHYLPG